MKKLLALLLCLVMVVSLFAACGGGDETDPTKGTQGTINTGDPNSEPTDPTDPLLESPYPKEMAAPEEIPFDPAYYLSFEDATNLTAMVQQAHNDADGDGACDNCTLTGATYEIVPCDSQILFTNGVKGNCIYLDGTYGVRLENLVEMTDDSYTISFWVNASTMANYMPSLQIGRNIGMNGENEDCTWINVTQVDFFGTGNPLFPTVWNRNSGVDVDGNGVLDYDDTNDIPNDGVWPWINMLDDQVHGKKEWVMVTIVATGETYNYFNADTGLNEPRVGCYLYVNGVEVMNGTADGITTLGAVSDYHGLSPKILTGDGLEGYLAINYWDLCMRAYFDELYIFDEALTAGQVATLFMDGDTSTDPVKPEASAPEVGAPVDPNAIDVVGTPDMLTGWWADWSKGFALEEGASVTVKLNNYSMGGNNWNNYCMVFTNVETPGHSAPSNVEGYAEYAVVRADLYGWGDASYAMTTAECNWLTSTDPDADWAAWRASMTDAEVTIVFTRNGSEITIESNIVCADGSNFTSKMVVTSTLTAEAPCYFFFVTDTDYLEILSVE